MTPDIDRLRAENAALKAALGEAKKMLVIAVDSFWSQAPKDRAVPARIRAYLEKSAEPPRENAALLGEANQAINTMLELWEAHTSIPPPSRADEIERALNRVRRAAARVSRALKEKSDG